MVSVPAGMGKSTLPKLLVVAQKLPSTFLLTSKKIIEGPTTSAPKD